LEDGVPYERHAVYPKSEQIKGEVRVLLDAVVLGG